MGNSRRMGNNRQSNYMCLTILRGLVLKGLRRYIRIGKLPVQNPVGARLGLMSQSCNEAPDELRVENRNSLGKHSGERE